MKLEIYKEGELLYVIWLNTISPNIIESVEGQEDEFPKASSRFEIAQLGNCWYLDEN